MRPGVLPVTGWQYIACARGNEVSAADAIRETTDRWDSIRSAVQSDPPSLSLI